MKAPAAVIAARTPPTLSSRLLEHPPVEGRLVDVAEGALLGLVIAGAVAVE